MRTGSQGFTYWSAVQIPNWLNWSALFGIGSHMIPSFYCLLVEMRRRQRCDPVQGSTRLLACRAAVSRKSETRNWFIQELPKWSEIWISEISEMRNAIMWMRSAVWWAAPPARPWRILTIRICNRLQENDCSWMLCWVCWPIKVVSKFSSCTVCM